MKAGMIGPDYIIHLDAKEAEFNKLKSQSLETTLIDADTGKDLGKCVILELGETDNPDGIEVNFEPKKRRGWVDITTIRIMLNKRAGENIEHHRRLGTRYAGSNMIDVFYS